MKRASLFVFVLAVLDLGFVGCSGTRDQPVRVDTHIFPSMGGNVGFAVFEPRGIPPLLTGSVRPFVAQVSPDGQWLYVLFAERAEDLAITTARKLANGHVEVDIRVRPRVCFVCTLAQPIGATRVRLDPAVEVTRPPVFLSDGEVIALEPWEP